VTAFARSGWGLARSLAIYRFRPWRIAALARFYGSFLKPGDIAFDVGAHVGNRTLALRRAGASVVAIEPQQLFHAFLRRTLPADVTLLRSAVGPEPGEAALAVSRLHPTVSSLRADYPEAVGAAEGFEHVAWDAAETVAVTTLDLLIAAHGRPRFVKIDVEGYEAEALAGLTQPIDLVAFEYLPAALDVAAAAVERIEVLGPYRFNLVRGESDRLARADWCDGPTLLAALREIAQDNASGDIYARLRTDMEGQP
jgi:FkbM family methyltransferase